MKTSYANTHIFAFIFCIKLKIYVDWLDYVFVVLYRRGCSLQAFWLDVLAVTLIGWILHRIMGNEVFPHKFCC